MERSVLRVATAFSGGLAAVEFALRYEEIEHEIVFACEWDKHAREQYLTFHGEPKTFYNDIRELDAQKYLNSIDLFVWGSPCQDVSLSGKREGFNGEKSSLFREGARVQSQMMPRVFIFENVPGLLSSNGGGDYAEVVRTFREQGYHIATTMMNTKEYGVPQNRERIFIVGFLDETQYHGFTPPKAYPLSLSLGDMLQPFVPQKYFLSQTMVDGFMAHKARHNEKGNGFAFNPSDGGGICKCINTKCGNRHTDEYIRVKI